MYIESEGLIMNILEVARIGLWLEDPYGDGIRLEAIRNPSEARVAAEDLIYNNQLTLGGEELIRNEYEPISKSNIKWYKRQH